MFKLLLSFIILAVTFTINAGERGYYLFVWGNSSGKEYFEQYISDDVVYSINSQCWSQRAGNYFREVYINTYPVGITDNLINSFLSGNNKDILQIRSSLRNFNDAHISHGFDGMLVINKKNNEIEINTIPLSGEINLYKISLLINTHDFQVFDKKLCEALAPIDRYFSP